jgi:hypothetical protein
LALRLLLVLGMKPTTRKRLSLSKETLRSLTEQNLRSVRGGALKTDQAGPCSYSRYLDYDGRCTDSGGYIGTDGCPSGVYSGCETIC